MKFEPTEEYIEMPLDEALRLIWDRSTLKIYSTGLEEDEYIFYRTEDRSFCFEDGCVIARTWQATYERLYCESEWPRYSKFYVKKRYPKELSVDRLKHSAAVANKCYQLATERYNVDSFDAEVYWVMGFLHDIGYAFCEDKKDHAAISKEIVQHLSRALSSDLSLVKAIGEHGNPDADELYDYLEVLNLADCTVDSQGRDCTILERGEDIKKRYGCNSKEYKDFCKVADKIRMRRSEIV